MWIEIAKQLGLFAIATAALAWLSKRILAHWLDKDVSRYKSELQRAHAVEIEKLRNDLRLRSMEHEVRFRSVYERQARVIATVYAKLQRLHASVSEYTRFIEWSGAPSKEDQFAAVQNAHQDFRSYFNSRKLFLPATLSDQVKEVSDNLVMLVNRYNQIQSGRATGSLTELNKQFEGIDAQIPVLLRKLEAAFRQTIGVHALEDRPREEEPPNNKAD